MNRRKSKNLMKKALATGAQHMNPVIKGGGIFYPYGSLRRIYQDSKERL